MGPRVVPVRQAARATLALLVAGFVLGLSSVPGLATRVSYEPILPAVSPDGSRVAWVEGANDQVVEARIGRTRPYLRGARAVGRPWRNGIAAIAWTRYGIIVDSNFTLYLLSSKGHVTKVGPAGDFAFSVRGSRVASGSPGCDTCTGAVVVIDVKSKEQWRLGDAGAANQEPSLSPNGKQVAWAAPEGIMVGTVAGGGSPHLLAPGGFCPRWSPDGHSIAYLAQDDSLQVVPATGGTSEAVASPPAGGCNEPGAPSWSPNSKRIAFEPVRAHGGGEGSLAIVNVNSDGLVYDSTRLGSIAGGFAWTADSSRLYVSIRPWAKQAAQNNCTALWLLHAGTLRGSRLLNGCH